MNPPAAEMRQSDPVIEKSGYGQETSQDEPNNKPVKRKPGPPRRNA
jgi:hypothetical protein